MPAYLSLTRDSTGFSRDVCAILCAHLNCQLHNMLIVHTIRLIANIIRCFFWLGARFEFALLLQSILMIVAQVRPIEPVHNETA